MKKKTDGNPLEQIYNDFLAFMDRPAEDSRPAEIGLDREGGEPEVIANPILPSEQNAFEKLFQMIGMEKLKQSIRRTVNYTKLMKVREQVGLPTPKRILHTVMVGNPGTGKTTVARLLAQIYYKIGILSRGHLIEVNREALLDSYIGGTEKRTREFLNAAKGGLLFVDEAYSLLDGSEKDFGRRVIDTLMPVLSEPNSDLIVVFAGYPQEMDKLMNSNPGLASRFPIYYKFDDYTADELMEIAAQYFTEYHYTLTPDALEKMKGILAKAAKQPNFGNGRFVKTLIENSILPNMAERLSEQLDQHIPFSTEVLSTLYAEDVPDIKDLALRKLPHENKNKIQGFHN